MAQIRYATMAEYKQTVGLPEQTDTIGDRDKAINNGLERASSMVDDFAGSWFDKRQVLLTTQAPDIVTRELFLPAPFISATSLVEDGVTLVLDTDYFSYESYLVKFEEKSWKTKFRSIVFDGFLGFNKAKDRPQDIKEVTIQTAAIMLGHKTKSFIQDDGVERTVNLNELPKEMREILTAHKWGTFHRQEDHLVFV